MSSDTLAMFTDDGRPDPSLTGVLVRRDARDTSRNAAIRNFPKSGTQRWQILLLLQDTPNGLTDDEISARLVMNPNAARPRRVELVAGGWVKDSGQRRPSAAGSPAAVWVYCPEPGR